MAGHLHHSTDGCASGLAAVSADTSVFHYLDVRAPAADFNVDQLHERNVRVLAELNAAGCIGFVSSLFVLSNLAARIVRPQSVCLTHKRSLNKLKRTN